MKEYKAYIFDLDGTLLDSMGVWEQIDVDFLAKRGIAVPPDYMDAVSPMSLREPPPIRLSDSLYRTPLTA